VYDELVLLQVSQLTKGIQADITLEGSLTCMLAEVVFKVAGLLENLVATIEEALEVHVGLLR